MILSVYKVTPNSIAESKELTVDDSVYEKLKNAMLTPVGTVHFKATQRILKVKILFNFIDHDFDVVCYHRLHEIGRWHVTTCMRELEINVAHNFFRLFFDNDALFDVESFIVTYTETEPILSIPSFSYREILLDGSAHGNGFEMFSNLEYLMESCNFDCYKKAMTVLMSVDNGDTFNVINNEMFERLRRSNNDAILRIETYDLHGRTLDIYGFNVSFDAVIHGTLEYRDVYSPALDTDTFKELVKSNALELTELVEDNKGWPVYYYQAKTLVNVDTLNAYELKSITDYKEIKVIFPNAKTLTQLSFDQFGLKYDDITNIHIVATTFKRAFGSNARPENVDIVYIPFLDQFFEINNVDDQKTNLNSITYYDCTLKLLTDRQSVEKDTSIIDINDMTDAITESFENAPNTPIDTEIGTIGDFISFDRINSGKCFYDTAEIIEIMHSDNYSYGVAYIEKSDIPALRNLETGLYRLEISNDIVTLLSLTGTRLFDFDFDDRLVLAFTKYIETNQKLTDFEKNMYYTSPIFPAEIKPLRYSWNVGINE